MPTSIGHHHAIATRGPAREAEHSHLDVPTLGGFADQIADRFAQRLAPTIVELVEGSACTSGPTRASATEDFASLKGDDNGGLRTARRVAAHYCVGASFAYRHAHQLGCIGLRGASDPGLDLTRDWCATAARGRRSAAQAGEARNPPSPRSAPRRPNASRGYKLVDLDR